MEKKNPYVTTIGFNKDDPDHVRVAELLNSMGRGKAQYLVKAVLAYQSMQENGQGLMMSGGTVDYELLRRMVIQILDERERLRPIVLENEDKDETEKETWEGDNVLRGFDDVTLERIMASMLAFHGE